MTVIDFLTCGSCQAEFPLGNIVLFMEHKKYDCRIALSASVFPADSIIENYTCFSCPKKFSAAISLLQHAQYQHRLMVFRNTDSAPSYLAPEDSPDQHATVKHQEPDDSKGLDNQESMPLSKCCTSVVPKKRKRHIETKHMRLGKGRMKMSSMPSDIYIDLDPGNSEDQSVPAGNEMNDSGMRAGIYLEPGNTYTIPINASHRGSEYVGFSVSQTNSNVSVSGSTHTVTSSPKDRVEPTFASDTPRPSTSTQGLSPSVSPTNKRNYPTTKPFKCDYCDHSFNQRIHLKKHLSKHTGVKPYKCAQCDYSTVERSHLKVHIRIHTGEKPFKCGHCEYATAQNSTLKIHLKRHHGGVLLECAHCGKSFPEKTQLYKHKQQHSSSELKALASS